MPLGIEALRLLVLGRVAELQVGTEAARAQRDGQPALRIVAEQLAVRTSRRIAVALVGELARVAAFGVVAAS